MTVPFLNQTQFLDLLRSNGWTVVCNDYFDQHDRIILEKNGHTFPFQLLKVYFYPIVVKTCKMLSIQPPADHLKCYEQQEALYNRDEPEE